MVQLRESLMERSNRYEGVHSKEYTHDRSKIGPHRRLRPCGVAVAEDWSEPRQAIELAVLRLMNDRFGHGQRVWVKGQVDSPWCLPVGRREVHFWLEPDGHQAICRAGKLRTPVG